MADYNEILRAMTGQFEQLAGFSPDAASDIGIRMKVLAAQIFSLRCELETLRQGLFPTTAQTEQLEMHAATRGIRRKAALPSSGMLRFYRQTHAAHDILIPAKTLCQTEGGAVQVETIADCVLPAGALSVETLAQSVQTGAETNIAAGYVTVFGTAPQGVYGVTNPTPFTGGQNAEEDTLLRERLLESYSTIANGTNTAFYYEQAMQHDAVYSASVIPRARGIGTVDVVAAGRGELLTEDALAVIEQELAKQKEICVDVAVRSPSCSTAAVTVALQARDGYGFGQVRDAVLQRIAGYFAAQRIGQPMHVSHLSAELCGVEGVYNHTLLAPAGDIPAAADQLIVLGEVTVTRMA